MFIYFCRIRPNNECQNGILSREKRSDGAFIIFILTWNQFYEFLSIVYFYSYIFSHLASLGWNAYTQPTSETRETSAAKHWHDNYLHFSFAPFTFLQSFISLISPIFFYLIDCNSMLEKLDQILNGVNRQRLEVFRQKITLVKDTNCFKMSDKDKKVIKSHVFHNGSLKRFKR